MNQSKSIKEPDLINVIQGQYLSVADEFISRVVYATEFEEGNCIIFEVALSVDTPEESEELSWHYSQWLTWDYFTQVQPGACGLRRCGLLETDYDNHNDPHVMTAAFKIMNDPGVVIEGIVNNNIGANFEFNTPNFSHIQYFLDQLRRIIIEQDQEKYSYDETDFPPMTSFSKTVLYSCNP